MSTFDALSTFSEKIYTTLDTQNSLLGIFIDFAKAFDTVRHDILLRKLNHYGIRGIVHDWFQDYLTNRTQTVKFLDHTSTPQQIKYGIPQGSVLGPILFLMYVNDLANIFTNIKTILFADDATLYITGKDPSDIIDIANTELKIFYSWCLSN